MKGYYRLRNRAMEMLRTQLPKRLYYHDYRHTLDVLNACNAYIRREKIAAHNAKLLRIGALLHDIGFVKSDDNHEENGVVIAEEIMGDLRFNRKDIKTVRGLIMATKIPQNPKNKLEEIICDADLDYLGRNDFYKIGDRLYEELKTKGIVTNRLDWNKLQIKFLNAHRYHTRFAKRVRRPKKLRHIEELRKLVG